MMVAILLSLTTSFLTAQEPPPAVKVVEIPPPKAVEWLEFKAAGGCCQLSAGDKPARWVLVDDRHARLVPDTSGKSAVFTADRAGVYHVLVVVGDAEPARVRITVGSVPPTPVPPNPIPPGPNPPNPNPPLPPAPPDALLARLKAAWEADTTQFDRKRIAARDLAELYRQAADLCLKKDDAGVNYVVLTSGELARRVRDAGHTLTPDMLVGVRKFVGEELIKIMPADAALTDVQRKSAAELFRALAAALDTF